MSKSLGFLRNKDAQTSSTVIGRMVQNLREQLASNRTIRPEMTGSALSLESIDANKRQDLLQCAEDLSTSLEGIAQELGIDTKKVSDAQVNAAVVAGILAGDFKGFISNTQRREVASVATEGMVLVQPQGLQDAMFERSIGLEAYDERENRDAVVYSIAYNYQAARQDEFGEAFFPTLTLAPNNVGFGVTVNLMMVYDAIERRISGDVTEYNKKNIIRAVADPTVLKKEQTRIVPVHRAQSAQYFAAGIAAAPTLLEGETINTAPLAFGKKIDLLGISQTDTLLAGGTMDMTDSVDPAIELKDVYVKIGDNIIRFDTSNLPLSVFNFAPQSNYRNQQLNFTTKSLLVRKGTKNHDGSALTGDLAVLDTADLSARLEVSVSGSVNIETGETILQGMVVGVDSVYDVDGNALPLDAGNGLAVVDAVDGAQALGFNLKAYRTNANRRQRGQLIDVTRYTQLYNVPLRAPITTIHPTTQEAQTDAADVQALVTATRIRTSNEAVSTLIEAARSLESYVDVRDQAGVGPDVMGVGRFFVRPAFLKDTVDMSTAIDSIKSHERAEDIQAVLVNKIRDMAYRLYRDSEYKAAADAMAGGPSKTPTVVIGTDPVLARYLTVTGDLRTLGNEFDIKIVSTLDVRVQGKIFVAFGVFDDTRNTAPNPLNFGNLVWAPELVLTANISRGNTLSKETVVQPRMLFITHCPIMGVLEVANIPDVLNKVTMNWNEV